MDTSEKERRVYGSISIALLTICLLMPALLITNVHSPIEDWWNTSWQYRKRITIDSTKVATDLTNFPVLIDTTDPDLASKAQNDADDIVFTDQNGIQLSHEIESYDSSSGHLVAWVNANLSSTTDTVLYMYYGNAGASNQEDASGVWDTNYVMVQHLEETEIPGTAYWNKYEGNPTLSGTRTGFASVFYDSDTSIYHLFCSWGSVLHFTSSDGKTGWTADPNNPVLSGNGEGVPMVWKEGGIWYMLYRYGAPDSIGLANSTDATNWTRYEGNPVFQNSPPSFIDPWGVIKVDSTYYLWYNDGFGVGSRAVGLATSTDLKQWTPDPNNPIFTGGRYCTFAFKYDGYYYMLVPHYTASPYGEIELYRDINPTFYSSSREYLGVPIAPGPAGAWDDHRFDTPCVLTDTIYRDTYTAANNELWTYYAATGTLTGSGANWWTGMCIEQNIAEAISKVSTRVISHLDSTINGNDGQGFGNMNMDVTGKIDGADEFDGSNDYVDCGDGASLKGMGALTIEAWVRPNRGNTGIVSKWGSWAAGTGGSYILFQNTAGNVGWGVVTETAYASLINTPILQTGQWHHLVGIYDGSQIRFYLNGTQFGSTPSLTGNVASTNHLCYIGRYTTPYMNGTIDEVRISNVSRSSGWITTEYNNQNSPSTFYTIGSEETGPTLPNTPPVATGLAITPSSPYNTNNLVGSYTYSDADGDPESGTEIRWYMGDVLQPLYNDVLIVSFASLAPGQIWYFTVRPRDGKDFGTLQTSPSVTIRTPIFSDGFEAGVPGNWNNRYQSRGTITQSSEQVHHESYSARVEAAGAGGWAIVSKTLSPLLSDAHGRCYVYFTAFPADTYQTCLLRTSGDMGNAPTYNIVAATVYNDGGTVKWAMVYENAGDYRVVASTPLPQLNTWYCVEIKTLVHETSGEARMYVNNVEILTQTGLGNNAYGNVEYCLAGTSTLPLGTNGIATFYVDCVTVDDEYIGPEEELPPPPDTTPPAYSNVGTNTTWANQPCLFHARWTDEVGLSGYVFGTNNTGIWLNETWTPMSGLSQWSNVTRILNPAVGALVQYRFYCNDTSNNWRSTPILSLILTELPTVYTSDLSISASSTSALVGYKVKIVGRLVFEHNGTGIANAPIELYYRVIGQTWNILTAVTTASEGSYYATWFPMWTGNHLIRAVYAGNEPNVLGSEAIISLIIMDIDEQIFSVSSNSTVSGLTFNSTIREITFSVEGPSGTTGYINIFLAKQLVPNINELKIYFDDIERSYEATSVDNVWFIQITYSHSVHILRITLTSASPTYNSIELATRMGIVALIALVASVTLLALSRKKKTVK